MDRFCCCIITPTCPFICTRTHLGLHMQIHTQMAAQYLERLAGSLWPSLSRISNVVIFFTSLGRPGTGGAHGFESGRVVVGSGGWGQLSRREISLLVGNLVCVCE